MPQVTLGNRVARRALALAALVAVAVVAALPSSATAHPFGGEWRTGGHDLSNTRSNPFERAIKPGNASQLAVKWKATTTGDVSATPAVVGGAVYFPDWGGTLWKLDADTGETIWSRKVADYVGIDGVFSRSSPAVVGNTLYIGTVNPACCALSPPTVSAGYLLAVDTRTGDLRFKTLVEDHPSASITGSPVVHGRTVYMGVSSVEIRAVIFPTYKCCSFRGSMVAVDAITGKVRWKTHTIPENGTDGDRFSGGTIWSGGPTIDPLTGTLYATTGNNYSMPKSAYDCKAAGGTARECLPDWNIYDSVVAFDLRDGSIKWVHRADWFDVWNGDCANPQNPGDDCPVPGPSYDYGAGATLFTVKDKNGKPRRLVGAAQKGGIYWMLDARTGKVVWQKRVGPDGDHWSGIQWGVATDGKRIYFNETNFGKKPHTMPDGTVIDYSSFGAIDPATGQILWQVPEPHGGMTQAAVSTANGVVYIGSLNNHMYALDARNGALLWDFAGEGASNAGPSIAGGTVFWGNGYANNRLGLPSKTFYAFHVPGT
ncbi:outer membrane protein assembly factor BamB family protein [Micromonospora sp. CPCC 206061]|uniref:outer membrane protein assembly factor BamB family protein n=1 Tax=Micromonospora sp. CPCC 206061 TaxID=3122410 RepID=UPI002FF0976D